MVANHLALILLPMLLDLFLWLGPHMRLKQWLAPAIAQVPLLPSSTSSVMPDPALARQGLLDFFEHFNLFSVMRTYPVGLASLMLNWMPIDSPLGKPTVMEAASFLSALGWFILLVLVGWLIGSLYFHWVSGVALKLEHRSLLQSTLQTILLSFLWLMILITICMPALIVLSFTFFINPVLTQGVLILFGLFSVWIILPVFFSPHGIYTYQQNAFLALLGSLRLVRYTLPTSGLFLVGVYILGQGLDFLWRIPSTSSWWVLVGIIGHAFITTALLAASFVYYRDINAWLNTVLERLKTQPTSVQI